MLTYFNRRELLITMDMKRQGEVRSILDKNGIQYDVKITNLENSAVMGKSRGRTGSLGLDQKYVYEYKIYVRKEDFDRVSSLIR